MGKRFLDYIGKGGIEGKKFIVGKTIYEVLEVYQNSSTRSQMRCRTYHVDNPNKVDQKERMLILEEALVRNDPEYVPENLANLSEQLPKKSKNLIQKVVEKIKTAY